MARHVLIIDKSGLQRRALQANILAVLDDVLISEAASIDSALPLLEKSTIHLVIYGLEKDDQRGIDFCKKELAGSSPSAIPYFFIINDEQIISDELPGTGHKFLKSSSTSKELAGAINSACNPVCLRKSKRYSIPGTHGKLEQRSVSFAVEILNVSSGGTLCDFEVGPSFNCVDPFMMSICFVLDKKEIVAEQLYSVVSKLKVIKRNSDYTPRKVRVGINFINVPDSARENFELVFSQLES